MIEDDSDPLIVSPGELEAVALDAISHDAPPNTDAAEEATDESVVAYCDRLALDVPARLRVFQAVCRAVHAAHQRGTIFGDLSPERLRTTSDGEVVIRSAGPPPASTSTAVEAWTSPEQVLGEPATTATDVYALGVVLYELLTGRFPYEVDRGDSQALAKAISEQSPQRPGKGDLDWITLKALRKEPERRYASADALAEDLDRFAQGLPVEARQPSEWHRVGKFLNRRRWIVSAAGAAVLAAVFVGFIATRAVATARRDREKAERLYRSARASVEDVFWRLAEDRRRDGEDADRLRRDLLDGVARYYEDFIAAHRDDPEARAELAEAVARSATIARTIGLKNEAEARFREAINLWGRLIAANPDAADAYRERLARSQAELGRSLDADGGPDSKADEAVAAFEAARDLLSPLVDARPDARPLRRELARVLRDEAAVHDRGDRPGPAIDLLRQSIRLQEELDWEAPRDLGARLDLASAYGALARMDAKSEAGRRGARAALERAVELLGEAPEAAFPDPPPRLAFETAQRLIDLANIERTLDAQSEAVGHALRAGVILESLTARLPTEASYQLELAAAYNVVADLRRTEGALAQALEVARKAQDVLDRLLREQPRKPSYTIELATTHQLIGRALAQSGKYDEALQSFRRAVDLLEGLPNLKPASQYNLAVTLSLALALIGAKEGAPLPDDEDLEKLAPADALRRRLYGERAVAALGQAVAQGYKALDLLRTDSALDPLRARADFQKLVADLSAAETP